MTIQRSGLVVGACVLATVWGASGRAIGEDEAKAGASARPGERVFLRLEAEDFDDAPLHPDWHIGPGQGWYAMEQYHFSGYAGAVCDAQSVGAQMTYMLERPLPAGRYKFFLHLLRMRDGGTNALRVTVGGQSWKVAWSADTYEVRDYAVDAHAFTLERPARTIRIRALQIERHNIGDVPSYPIPTILLDAITVTNDLRQQVVRQGRRQTVGLGRVPAGPADGPAEAIEIPAGNRIRNGSFEVPATTTWFAEEGRAPRVSNMVEGGAHGGYCLRMPVSADGKRLPMLFSNVFPGRGGEDVPVRLHLRSSVEATVEVRVLNSRRRGPRVLRAQTGPQWKRFAATAKLPPDETGRYYLTITARGGKPMPKVYVDAVAVGLPAGEAYRQCGRLEAGLAGERLANIYHDKDQVPAVLMLSGAAPGPKGRPLALELVVRDYRSRVVVRRDLAVVLPPEGRARREMNLAAGRWGVFSAVVRGKASGEAIAELVYVCLPEREKAEPSPVGFYGASWDARTMGICKALGVGWQATLADGRSRWVVPPERIDGVAAALDVPARFGRKVIYAVEVLRSQPREEDVHYEGTQGMHAHPPNLQGLEANLRRLAARIHPKVAIWNLQDEMYEGKCPVDAWPLYHKVAVDAIRGADPDAKIIVSSMPAFQRRVLQLLGRDYLWGVCDPAFSPGRGDPRVHGPYRRLADEWDLPLVFSGFGFSTSTFYRTRAADMRLEGQASRHAEAVHRTTAAMTAHRLEFRPDIFVLYSAIPSLRAPTELRTTNIYDLDGSVIPLAAAYAWTGRFLEDATEPRRLDTPHGDLMAYAFRREGQSWLVFWVDPGVVYGEIRRGEYIIELGLDAEAMAVFGNPYPAERADGRTRIRFQGQPIYLRCGDTPLDRLAEAMRAATFQNRLALRGVCLGGADDTTRYAVFVRNGTDERAGGPLALTEQRGLLQAGRAVRRAIEPLEPGGVAQVVFPITEGLAVRRALTQGRIGADFQDGRCHARFDVWCMPARRAAAPPAIDARLADWQGHVPAFIFPILRASGGYGLRQVRRGAEHITGPGQTACRIYAAWDADNLYLALRAIDDDVQPAGGDDAEGGDRLVVCLDTKLVEDVFDGRRSADDFFIRAAVPPEGGEAQVRLQPAESPATDLKAAYRRVLAGSESGYCFEIVCPWRKLGVRPKPGLTLGFDVRMLDADGGRAPRIEAAWAGYGAAAGDPTAYGQLVLR